MEDKQKICDALCAALQLTRGAYDLIRIEYDAESETVHLLFKGGTRSVCVISDSGTAMIKDIVNNMEC